LAERHHETQPSTKVLFFNVSRPADDWSSAGNLRSNKGLLVAPENDLDPAKVVLRIHTDGVVRSFTDMD